MPNGTRNHENRDEGVRVRGSVPDAGRNEPAGGTDGSAEGEFPAVPELWIAAAGELLPVAPATTDHALAAGTNAKSGACGGRARGGTATRNRSSGKRTGASPADPAESTWIIPGAIYWYPHPSTGSAEGRVLSAETVEGRANHGIQSEIQHYIPRMGLVQECCS